jgi:hypothetical protein
MSMNQVVREGTDITCEKGDTLRYPHFQADVIRVNDYFFIPAASSSIAVVTDLGLSMG